MFERAWIGVFACLVGLSSCSSNSEKSETSASRWSADAETATSLGVHEWSVEGTDERSELFGRGEPADKVVVHATFHREGAHTVIDVDLPARWHGEYTNGSPSPGNTVVPPDVGLALTIASEGAPSSAPIAGALGAATLHTTDTPLLGGGKELVQPQSICLISGTEQLVEQAANNMTGAQKVAATTKLDALTPTCEAMASATDKDKCVDNAARLAVGCGSNDMRAQRKEYEIIYDCVKKAQQNVPKPTGLAALLSFADPCVDREAQAAISADKAKSERRKQELQTYYQKLFADSPPK
jgi:hypothetical protein